MDSDITFLKDIVDRAPLPIAVLEGEQLKIILANRAMIASWGKGDEIIGKNYLDVLPEVKEDRFFEQALNVLKTGVPFHAADQKVNLLINGVNKLYYYSYSFTPLYNKNGEVYAVMNTGTDVTDLNLEKQKFEDELKIQVADHTQELRRSNDDLLQFANIVSHDLREPIRKMKRFEAMLREEAEPIFTENAAKYLNKIGQSIGRMENIVEGILGYSTLDKTMQRVEKIDLNQIIEDIKTDLELIIEEKGAVLITSEFPVIEGARILILQLFYNLIQNALKFSKADLPPKVIISCNTIENNGIPAVEIIVKDNGIGLDDTFAERIFTAFERLHSRDQYEGNGLGLSLCRKIVTRHKGTITAKSQQDDGAEFIVILPLKQVLETI